MKFMKLKLSHNKEIELINKASLNSNKRISLLV
jgi:hypothetical protein